MPGNFIRVRQGDEVELRLELDGRVVALVPGQVDLRGDGGVEAVARFSAKGATLDVTAAADANVTLLIDLFYREVGGLDVAMASRVCSMLAPAADPPGSCISTSSRGSWKVAARGE